MVLCGITGIFLNRPGWIFLPVQMISTAQMFPAQSPTNYNLGGGTAVFIPAAGAGNLQRLDRHGLEQ